MRQAVAVDLVDDDIPLFTSLGNDHYELVIEGDGRSISLIGSLKQFAYILAAMHFDPAEPPRPHLHLVPSA